MDYELHLAGLEIEITRDCNLNCPHCMRYEPNEPMDAYRGTVIAPEVIDALFDRYRHIERKRLIFRYYQKNIRLLFSSRSTLTIHI